MICLIQRFEADFLRNVPMESQPQNPENFHPYNIQLIKNNQLIVIAVIK